MKKGIDKRNARRRRIIACCVPLCLCFAVLAAIMLPSALSRNGTVKEIDQGGRRESFAKIDMLSNNGLTATYTADPESESFDKLLALLDSTLKPMTEPYPEANGDGADAYYSDPNAPAIDGVDGDDLQSESEGDAMVGVVLVREGCDLRIMIMGREVTDLRTNKKAILSGEELAELIGEIDRIIEAKEATG